MCNPKTQDPQALAAVQSIKDAVRRRLIPERELGGLKKMADLISWSTPSWRKEYLLHPDLFGNFVSDNLGFPDSFDILDELKRLKSVRLVGVTKEANPQGVFYILDCAWQDGLRWITKAF